MQFGELRLGIKRVDLRNAARHVAEDYVLCLGAMMQSDLVGKRPIRKQSRQRHAAETGRAVCAANRVAREACGSIQRT